MRRKCLVIQAKEAVAETATLAAARPEGPKFYAILCRTESNLQSATTILYEGAT